MKNENMFMPVIKWSGSKRFQAPYIINEFPHEIDTYYEPFCGSCAVLKHLMASEQHKVNRYVCSDINQDLINVWNNIKNNPALTVAQYTYRWYELNKDDDDKRRHEYYYTVRERFNNTHDADDFLFIMRTCFNGLVRYNSDNKFNSSFHFSRKGIRPERLEQLIYGWSDELNKNNVEFICQSYDSIKPHEGDFVYLDPPYVTTTGGMFFKGFDYDRFYAFLETLPCHWALSYDGISGKVNHTTKIPETLYKEMKYILSGKSSFRKYLNEDIEVYDALYIK